ncbi:MAG: TolC family protein [Planctomycetes bacterium]|nr:TolC family protein [Planctomycetota bacterium]
MRVGSQRWCKRGSVLVLVWMAGLMLAPLSGCQKEALDVTPSISVYRDRMLAEDQEQVAAQDARPSRHLAQPVAAQAQEPPRASLVTQPPPSTQSSPEMVLMEMPDPSQAEEIFQARLRELEQQARRDPRDVRNYTKTVAEAMRLLQELTRPTQIRLSLAECIQRALANNYDIRLESYNPGISQSQLVEAEAAFDAVFFLDTSWSNQDQATSSALYPQQSDARSIQGGIRKVLPTGMQVETSLRQQRAYTDLQFATLNPAYSTSFVASLRQPLLRGFGLDVNRAQINISRVDRRTAHWRFVQKVRDTLLRVEMGYWQLVQARRDAAIMAVSVAQNFVTYEGIQERQKHDSTPVQLANSKSRWRSRYVGYLEAVKRVRDAEDALKNLLNDADLKLSVEAELIPTEVPLVAPLALDQFAEVRTAVDRRSEIQQARLGIERARIQTMAAKNQLLPQLDLSFQYEVQGIDVSSDASFDNLTTNRFRSYAVSAAFSYPFGNRAARAAHRRARMQESQSIVGLHQITDAVVLEVNTAVRTLMVRYTQIPPQLEATHASARNLSALQARTPEISPSYLETELSAVEQLANARRTLLQVVIDYNLAIADLEKSRGTLLEYNNVAITDEPPGR